MRSFAAMGHVVERRFREAALALPEHVSGFILLLVQLCCNLRVCFDLLLHCSLMSIENPGTRKASRLTCVTA